MKVKNATTFEEQLDILKARGITIADKEKAKNILENINYYRLTAYLLEFKNSEDMYTGNKTFDDMYRLYKFDKKLRMLILDVIGTIEISFRTYIAYTLAQNHKPLGYRNHNNFINKHFHNNFILCIDKEKNQRENEPFIKHHIEKYDGNLPIWVAVEIMSFGELSKLYCNMIPTDTTYIKNNLCSVNPELLKSWLPVMNNLRNRCAHYGRLYNSVFQPIKVEKKKYKKYSIDNTRLFSYILAMKSLVFDEDTWVQFYKQLVRLIEDNSASLRVELIGFPNEWREILQQ